MLGKYKTGWHKGLKGFTTYLRLLFPQLNRRKEQMAQALKQQQQELQEKRKRFDEDKRLFEEEHQRYMKELEDSMRFAPLYVYREQGCVCVCVCVCGRGGCGRGGCEEGEGVRDPCTVFVKEGGVYLNDTLTSEIAYQPTGVCTFFTTISFLTMVQVSYMPWFCHYFLWPSVV